MVSVGMIRLTWEMLADCERTKGISTLFRVVDDAKIVHDVAIGTEWDNEDYHLDDEDAAEDDDDQSEGKTDSDDYVHVKDREIIGMSCISDLNRDPLTFRK
jgi:hypothetical protein